MPVPIQPTPGTRDSGHDDVNQCHKGIYGISLAVSDGSNPISIGSNQVQLGQTQFRSAQTQFRSGQTQFRSGHTQFGSGQPNFDRVKPNSIGSNRITIGSKEAMGCLTKGFAAASTFYGFPKAHWRRLRTTNSVERLHGEIKRRTKAVGAFPDRASALRLITAVALKVTAIWSDRRYLDLSLLEHTEVDQAA